MSIAYHYSRRRSRASGPPGLASVVPEGSAWRRALATPDPIQMDAGAEGELIVARARTALIAALIPVPILNLVLDSNATAGIVGLVACGVALVFTIGVQTLLRRDFYRPWLGLVTSLLDITVVSGALASFLFLGQPITTVNSRLVFEVYFIAIGATALRYDARITVSAGLCAISQYLALILTAHALWDLTDPRLDQLGYGSFDWATQISRLILLGVATLLATAIVLRSQRLRRQSRSDRLTGLPNRSFFDERVQAELSRARRYGEPVSLAMIDIDHFKKFNDTWGHAAGDVALKGVAAAILASVRQSDLLVRYGGEEFVVLLPGMDVQAAMERVEDMRMTVEQLPLSIPRREDSAKVTVSIGLAVYGLDGTQAEDLLDRADARLFEAKGKGRNRLIGPPPGAAAPAPSGARSS